MYSMHRFPFTILSFTIMLLMPKLNSINAFRSITKWQGSHSLFRTSRSSSSSGSGSSSDAFYLNTPLVPIKNLQNEKLRDCNVLLKLDYLQPSGSFKDRGISHMIRTIMREGQLQRLICSSGGNAGHAVATVGRAVGVPVDVFVPTTTKPMMVSKLRAAGASVTVHGSNWNEADALAQETVKSVPGAYYIPPYNDPRIWEGHASIVDELAAAGVRPDTIVLSVGGGGLLAGVQQGVLRHGWEQRTRIIAAETLGCDSFAAAHRAGQPVQLPRIASIATSLGALSVLPQVLQSPVRTEPLVVSDAQAVLACRRFADDFNALVEPACGAALAAAYADDAPFRTISSSSSSSGEKETIVIIVCGGSVVNVELMAQWCDEFGVASLYG